MKRDFWKKYFEVYDILNLLPPYEELLNEIVAVLNIHTGEKILEAGCGTGNLALKIKSAGASVVGLDNCREALGIYKLKDSNAIIVEADLLDSLPFSDNSFDKIVMNNVLYAFPYHVQLTILKELKRILKINGVIVIANLKKGWSPCTIYFVGIKAIMKREGILYGLYRILSMILPTIKIFWFNRIIQKQTSYLFLTPEQQKKLMEAVGFVVQGNGKSVYAGQSMLYIGQKRT